MKINGFILTVLLVLFNGWLHAQVDTTEAYSVSDTLEDFGMFTRDEVFEISLRFNVTEYTRKKPKEEYLDAILTYHISKTDSVNRNVRLKSRGEFRNGYCSFPPLVLNFKKTDFELDDLNKLEKVKVVTHCKSGSVDGLYREYLAYKLYNQLTDTSFRARLVRINYINTAKNTKPIRTFAFFIEPIKLLGERIQSLPIETSTLTQRNIYDGMMDRIAIFNYMIGNTDWSVPNQHNVRVFLLRKPDGLNLGIGVPYDFDYSGLVNASYAIPAEGLDIETVRERIYLGRCRDEASFLNALKEFEEKKEFFYKVIHEFPYLSERSKKDMLNFLDSFYAGFDKRNSVVDDLRKDCKDF